MTLLNFTFQEASPLITYSTGGWVEGSSSNDTFSASYNGSFRVSFTRGATASFSFVGTGVSLFGATRPNHGNYSVTVDQQLQFIGDGSTGVNAFNKSLWHADNLGYTQHTVMLTNVPTATGQFLDLDFISIERQIGQDGDKIFQATLDDTSPLVQFTGSWESTTGASSAYQGTLHSTKVANSQVVVPFQGCCIEVYGQYANAQYTVILDEQPPLNMKGLDVDLTPNFQHPQTLLYLVDGLSEGSNHTVTLINNNTDVNRPFFFDYALISSTHEFNSAANPVANSPSDLNGSNQGTHSPTGAIVGGVVAGVMILLLTGVAALLFVRRRRRRRRAEKAFPLDLIDEEPKPYILPNQPGFEHYHEQDASYGRTLPPLPPDAVYAAPPSKFRSPVALNSSDHNTEFASSDGLLSPQEQFEASGSSSHGRITSTTTSASRSVASSASTSRRGTKSRFSFSQRGAGEGSRAQEAVQEEDAGIVLEQEEVPVSRTLPPAYNPEWHRDPDPLSPMSDPAIE